MMRFAILACSSWLVLFLPAAAPGADFQSKYCSIELPGAHRGSISSAWTASEKEGWSKT